ncbi:MAG TPA: hypothetical protein VHF92_03230 [Geodermatophilus sp.]|nr:hypothetical protein [Geodermatophilus sp.]
MLWATVAVVGFVLMTALVIVLARSSTARWEREKRGARAPLPEGVGVPEPAPRGLARLRAGLAPTAVAAERVVVRARSAPPALVRALSTARAGALARVRPAAPGPGAAEEPATGEASEDTAQPALTRRTSGARRRLRRRTARPGSGRAAGRLPHRLAARFARRRDAEQPQPSPQPDADESATA